MSGQERAAEAISPKASRRRDPAAVAAALESWLPPRLGAAAVRVTDLVAPKGAGFSNETYLFTAMWGERSAQLVLQVPPPQQGLMRDHDFAVMARVQQRLAAVSTVPVAPVRWFEDDVGVLGKPFYVMERVPGMVPTDTPPYHREGWFATQSSAVKARIWWSGIDALAELHRLDIEQDGFAFMIDAPWGMPLDADPAERRLAQWRSFFAWAAPDPCPLVTEALDILDRTRPARSRISVSWGDSKLSNCIVTEEGVRALLDWELCGVSDPEEDLAHWLLLDWSLWAAPGIARLPDLPGGAATVVHYEKVSGRPTRAVGWWFRFGLVRLAIIYHRIQALRRSAGRYPPETPLATINPVTHLIEPLFAREDLP